MEEVGGAVKAVKPGPFVVGSFATTDDTCPNCQYGYPSSCVQREFMTRGQAPVLRVPLADGTLVPTPGVPSDDLVPGLLAAPDVLGTGWFAADAANVKPGSTVVVVGDGAVGLLSALSAKQMGAERIIVMSRHETRQTLARAFGATDIVPERGDEGVTRIVDMTNGGGLAMSTWSRDELRQIAEADDLHISPLREDGGRTVPRHGSGPSRSAMPSMCALTTGRTLVGIGRRCGRRRGGSPPPA